MSQLLSRHKTAEVIDRLEDVLRITLYERLSLSQVNLCASHFAETKQILDDFDIQVNFDTVPQLRQTTVSFTLTPKSRSDAPTH